MNGRFFSLLCLIDSGADFCLFPAIKASELGIDLPNERSIVFSGSADQRQYAYFDTVSATLRPVDSSADPITFDLYAGFCKGFEHAGTGVLGQSGFFSRFKVAFDYGSKLFTIS